ncbi:bacterial extracellular solute-binding protein, family 3 [Thecamonas trahens ATCC 50062]|uniref:Bacterial extracellular solute-binding protein, family 3 n=1 Tax=Thecamonas trahens ATCC 50062 TaxID=461836 RepID=A0A0L0DM41_THETB|nr:bacterial extracellular solute-binding protein, family 3 [Thecamonas trahens ATCC 50062]KNC52458.1 bacterial extracellular solute-binding protein, family 3 [Thecamonas trahens ATCC 50062]|eukprot:XP_013755261.1 bacterial extracellular solute-binding protein, family 3 [Thecamonas trahens ATCC 50062]
MCVAPARDHKTVAVCFAPTPPFVLVDVPGGETSVAEGIYGYDVELWEYLVDAMVSHQAVQNVTFDRQLCSWREMLNRTASDSEAVIGLGGITITGQRAESRDFTHPYFHSGVEIMLPARETVPDFGLVFQPFTPSLWISVVVIIGISGVCFWALEHTYQPEAFPLSLIRGVNEGTWFAWSIVSETKEHDLIGMPARLYSIGFTWFAVALVAAYTASLTATIAAEQLDSQTGTTLSVLHNIAVATVIDTTAETFVLERVRASRLLIYATVDEALQALTDGLAKALVYDAAVLEYLINNDARARYARLLGNLQTSERFALAVSRGVRGLAAALNLAILDALDAGVVVQLNNKYFGKAYLDSGLVERLTVERLDFNALAGSYVIMAGAMAVAILSYLGLRVLKFCC